MFTFNESGAVINYIMTTQGVAVVDDTLQPIIDAMREWVEDCAVDVGDLENRQNATDKQIYNNVRRYYEGGIRAFLLAGEGVDC